MKASRAAREAGYTSDYVGQLCRSGAIDAELVGRSWYVNVDELREHRKEKKRSSRIHARKQVKTAIAEAKQVTTPRTSELQATKVRYEGDSSALFPEVRSLKFSEEETVLRAIPRDVLEPTPKAVTTIPIREEVSEKAEEMLHEAPAPIITPPRQHEDVVRSAPLRAPEAPQSTITQTKSSSPVLNTIAAVAALLLALVFLAVAVFLTSSTTYLNGVLSFQYQFDPAPYYLVTDYIKGLQI